ncbi:MAG: methyltransferase domain-containing protein [Flavobacteriia bacterium]|nr:methyltransferase domain-containing protein [Flavobacteriia bacterium]
MKEHWENIYQNKSPEEVSWTQKNPELSLQLIQSLHLSKKSSIIDVGSGESILVDSLINQGFQNIHLLDISQNALNKVKKRLSKFVQNITFHHSNSIDFKPSNQFDLWHDRATFHFLTEVDSIEKYVQLVNSTVSQYLIIATFSKNGPKKCSGLEIKQYDEKELKDLFSENFSLEKSIIDHHKTPFDTEQEFIYVLFKRKINL